MVTNSILKAENAQENKYKVKTNQREYVRYLKCTLYVFTPNNNESKEIENNETSFAAISGPSGCDDWPMNASIKAEKKKEKKKRKKGRTILSPFFFTQNDVK